MAIRLVLLAMSALALTGCASYAAPGYAYCYDPYRGPVGYHYSRYEAPPACATAPAQQAYYSAPQEAGYRGPYVSGPYPAAAAPTEGR